MVVAHLIVGMVGGLLAAAWMWFGAGASLWLTIAAYAVAGNIACLVSAGLTLLIVHLRHERREKPRLAPDTGSRQAETRHG